MAEENQNQTQNTETVQEEKTETAKKGKSQSKAVKELEQKLIESEKKAEEYRNSWYRTAADFENYKKRNADARSNAYADGRADAIKSLLAIGDNLDRALTTVTDDRTKTGLELTVRQFVETLKNMGVEEINPVGEVFDPNIHEAIASVNGPVAEPTCSEVYLKGYKLKERVIRHAKVMVQMPDGSVNETTETSSSSEQ